MSIQIEFVILNQSIGVRSLAMEISFQKKINHFLSVFKTPEANRTSINNNNICEYSTSIKGI